MRLSSSPEKHRAAFQALSLAVPLLTITAAFLLKTPYFRTNDDSQIQDALSGGITGAPYPYHQFIHPIAGLFETFLFGIAPSIPWWFLTELLCCVLGAAFLNYALLSAAQRGKGTAARIPPLMLIILFNFLYFLYNTLNVSFTISPVILGGGSVALLLADEDCRTSSPVLAGLLVVLASLIRYDSGIAVLCFYLVGLLWWCMRRADTRGAVALAMRYIPLALPPVLLILALGQADSYIQRKVNGEEFMEFNAARIRYVDYKHISYEENPGLFESFGVGRQKAQLLWFFMDKAFSADFFNAVADGKVVVPAEEIEKNQKYYPRDYSPYVMDSFAEVFLPMSDRFVTQYLPGGEDDGGILYYTCEAPKREMPFRFQLKLKSLIDLARHIFSYRRAFMISAALLSLVPLYVMLRKRRISEPDFIASALATAGMWGLILLLHLKGRPIDRALLCCTIPMFCVNSVMLCKNIPLESPAKKRIIFLTASFAAVCLFLSAASVGCTFSYTNSKQKSMRPMSEIFDYMESRPEDIFICNLFSSMPFRSVPRNLFTYGIPSWKSDLWRNHLAALGLDDIDMTTFSNDNVYLATTSVNTAYAIFKLLSLEYGFARARCTEITKGFFIVRFFK